MFVFNPLCLELITGRVRVGGMLGACKTTILPAMGTHPGLVQTIANLHKDEIKSMLNISPLFACRKHIFDHPLLEV